ncbi:oxygen-independent coproporphyrinogen III oxidase [Peristeroidobacter agariperforans]|uniref:oxygen-independent coproporphyrinogen III oxidase n=1 Tax=Peristeroidobacter agariperforans TaxID=268404 RepID=UPI00101CBF96|nr:oxygen-independent coproporphyrinogen III oxidase [Peristeroidobacter agariperforans]
MRHITLTCDPELLRRYDQPGPRYTSYPTAPQFGPHFQEAMLREYIRRSNEELIPRRLSLYVHVPYCTSPCFYCGCNRIITRDRTAGRRYVERLIREISLAGPLFDRDREVIQVHFGGGTPNFLRPDELRDVMSSLGQQFQLSNAPVRDFSIEIDPRFVNAADIAAYADMGLNRASLGVQDFDPVVQAAVNRVQTVQQTLAAIQACRRNGFRSINVDLIYGLPHQTLEGFGPTLDTVIGIRPHRLAVYGYAHMPHLFKPQRRIDAAHLPNAEQRIALLSLAIDKLTSAGYVYIGMDHFALPEDDLTHAYDAGTLHRNFMGYTTHADCDLLGLGVSAISHIGDSFSQNPRDLASWEIAVDSGRLPVWRGRHLDQDDQVRAEVIQQLMCGGSVDISAVERRYDIDFHRYFADALARMQPLVSDGLAVIERSRISATSRGRLLLRIIAMCFDRYLTPKPPAQAQYSSAV